MSHPSASSSCTVTVDHHASTSPTATAETLITRAFSAKFKTVSDEDVSTVRATPAILSFYDRHVAPANTWKHIEELPSMEEELCNLARQKVEEYYKTHPTSSLDELYGSPRGGEVTLQTAGRTTTAYEKILDYVSLFASRLYFLPSSLDWHDIFTFSERHVRTESDLFKEQDLVVVDVCKNWDDPILRLKEEQPDLWEVAAALRTDHMDKTLSGLVKTMPRMATWHLFPSSKLTDGVVDDLARTSPSFWRTSHTVGCTINTENVAPMKTVDSDTGFISSLPKAVRESRNRLIQSDKMTPDVLEMHHPSPNIVIPPFTKLDETPLSSWALQHAWTTAVHNDSTFMIFGCGSSERIGIRHRASQTLYLSPLITPGTNPRYGQLHVGLHLAIVEDALRRHEIIEASKKLTLTSLGKRQREAPPSDSYSHPKKKRRSDPEDTARSRYRKSQLVAKTLATRALALVSLNYACYFSPVPSSFIRIGPSCAPGLSSDSRFFRSDIEAEDEVSEQETFSLSLGEPISSGVGGIIHPATSQMKLSSGEVVTHHLILKLAIREQHRDDLEREYQNYNEIARRGHPHGILTVHGLFRDSETGVLGMLMEDGGESLRAREIRRSGNYKSVSTTATERFACIRALKSLHKIGFRHGDVHTGNILLHHSGDAYVIDLNGAEMSRNISKAGAREVDHLKQLLLGANS